MLTAAMFEKKSVLEAVARRWNEEGISYGVAHGLEGYPNQMGRDLDVVFEPAQTDHALRIAEAVLTRSGLQVARPSPLWGPRIIAAAGEASLEMLEIHAPCGVSWANVPLVDRPHPSIRSGPFRIDPWASVAKRVVLSILAGNTQKFVQRPAELALSNDELYYAPPELHRLFGPTLARAIVEAISTGDVDELERLAPVLRSAAVIRSACRHPLRSAELVLRSLYRKLVRPLTPCAPVVAIVGPDGVGKTTVLNLVKENGRLIFTDVVARHWRPALLPPLGKFLNLGDDRMPGTPPRRHPGHLRWLRIVYYYFDFLIGGFFKDRIDSSRQRLVLYDRWFTDMSVDPLRYGLGSARGIGFLARFLPRPDLIILLRDLPQHIHRRKAELPPEEIERQYRAWERWVAAGQVQVVKITDLQPEEIAGQIVSLIAATFLQKNHAKEVTAATESQRCGRATPNPACLAGLPKW